MAFSHPEPRRVIRGLLVALVVTAVAGSSWGFAVAVDGSGELSSMEIGTMRAGDEIRYEHDWRLWWGADWAHDEGDDPELLSYAWEPPQELHAPDGHIQEVNVLRVDDEWVGQELDHRFYVDPETGNAIAHSDTGGSWGRGGEALGMEPVYLPAWSSESSHIWQTVRHAPTTLPCGFLPSLPPTLEVGQTIPIEGCDRLAAEAAVDAVVDLARRDGEPTARLVGNSKTTLAEVFGDEADELPPELRDRPATVEMEYQFAAGIPYPTAYRLTYSFEATYQEFGLDGGDDEDEGYAPDAAAAMQIRGSLEHYRQGSGQELWYTPTTSFEELPVVRFAPAGPLGPTPLSLPGFYSIEAAIEFAKANTDGELEQYFADHPDAYVARAEHRNVDDQGAQVQAWELVLHDGVEGYQLAVQHRNEPVGHAASRHGPVDAPLALQGQKMVYWGEPQSPHGFWIRPPPDMLPVQVATVDSLYALQQAWGGPVEGGLPTYSFDIWCATDCADPIWQVTAGDSWQERERTYGVVNDSRLEDNGAAQMAIIANDGVIGLSDGVYVRQESFGPAFTPDDREMHQDPEAVVHVDDLWWALPPAAAVIGAGVVGLVAGLLYTYGPSLKLLGLGMFSRIRSDKVLEHPVRRSIHLLVEANPGIHLQEIARQSQRSTSVVRHHMARLQAAGLVATKKGPRHLCFFAQGDVADPVMVAASKLKSDGARLVLCAVIDHPGDNASQIAERIGLTGATVSYHMKSLNEAGLLDTVRRGRAVVAEATSLGRRAVAVA